MKLRQYSLEAVTPPSMGYKTGCDILIIETNAWLSKRWLLADSAKVFRIFVNLDTRYTTNNLMAVGIEHVRNLVPFKQFGSSGFPELDIKNFLFSFWFSTMNKLLLWTWHYISRNYLEKIYIISKLIGENI